MGIKYLNRFLREQCESSIKMVSMSELSGKKIVVDISIYLFKYASEGTLIENIYLMISIFHYYRIIPIFIFDGKPPSEKKNLIQKRREDRKAAEKEFNILKNQLIHNETIDEEDKQEIQTQMDLLKRQFISVNKEQIEEVKNLIQSYGATYYDAPGEADELCASLVIKNKVWACLSEDMDMFVYGCTRVIRYFSLLNHTAVLYDMKGILEQLGVSQKELREICVLSGTDYNINADSNSKISSTLYTTLKIFKKYRRNRENEMIEFYDWIQQNAECINDINLLYKINSMFDLSENTSYMIEDFENKRISNGAIDKEKMKIILRKEGFIYF